MEKRRNCSSNFFSFPLYYIYIFLTSGVKLHIHLLNVVVRFIVFLTSATLICRGTDISKYFRESLGIRGNESRLYFVDARTDPSLHIWFGGTNKLIVSIYRSQRTVNSRLWLQVHLDNYDNQLKGDASPNFRIFQIKIIVLTTIIVKLKNSYRFEKLHALKVAVTGVAIYSLVIYSLVKMLSHNALLYDVIVFLLLSLLLLLLLFVVVVVFLSKTP